jgi:hypothetical protein
MSIHFGTSGFVFERSSWQPEVLAKLESHHIAAWSSESGSRTRFGASLQQYLVSQPGVEVCTLHGRNILDLEGLCAQLERLIPVEKLARTVDGAYGVASVLRSRSMAWSNSPARQRILLWHDADVLIRHNPQLFGEIAEVIAGVSAELEYVGESPLMIQRCVYMGGERLADVARDPDSMLNSWAEDGPGVPFWSLVTGEESPMTALCSIESLLASYPS